jgi:hypothetical protein
VRPAQEFLVMGRGPDRVRRGAVELPAAGEQVERGGGDVVVAFGQGVKPGFDQVEPRLGEGLLVELDDRAGEGALALLARIGRGGELG